MMVLKTYQHFLEPQKKPSICAITYWYQRYYKSGIVVAKTDLVDHVGVTHNNVPGCSNKKFFLRPGIRKIPSI